MDASGLKPLCCEGSGPREADGAAAPKYPEKPYLTLPKPERFRLPVAAAGARSHGESILGWAVVAVVGTSPLVSQFFELRRKWKDAANEGIFALRASQPSARRVYQPAAFP